jgi:hypothetical protein
VKAIHALGSVASPHAVVFYERESFLAGAAADFLMPALTEGGCALVVATPAHWHAIATAIPARDIGDNRVEDAQRDGRLVVIDAEQARRSICGDDGVDIPRFFAEVSELVVSLIDRDGGVRIFGEMVALLWGHGYVGEALELEERWNELGATHRFELLCGYPMHDFCGSDSTASFREVCQRHTAFANEGYARLDGSDRMSPAVVVLEREGGAATSTDMAVRDAWPDSALRPEDAPAAFDRWVYRRCPEPLTDGGAVEPERPEALLRQLLTVDAVMPVETSLALGLGRCTTYARAADVLLWARHAPSGPRCPTFRAAYYLLEDRQGRGLPPARATARTEPEGASS